MLSPTAGTDRETQPSLLISLRHAAPVCSALSWVPLLYYVIDAAAAQHSYNSDSWRKQEASWLLDGSFSLSNCLYVAARLCRRPTSDMGASPLMIACLGRTMVRKPRRTRCDTNGQDGSPFSTYQDQVCSSRTSISSIPSHACPTKAFSTGKEFQIWSR